LLHHESRLVHSVHRLELRSPEKRRWDRLPL